MERSKNIVGYFFYFCFSYSFMSLFYPFIHTKRISILILSHSFTVILVIMTSIQDQATSAPSGSSLSVICAVCHQQGGVGRKCEECHKPLHHFCSNDVCKGLKMEKNGVQVTEFENDKCFCSGQCYFKQNPGEKQYQMVQPAAFQLPFMPFPSSMFQLPFMPFPPPTSTIPPPSAPTLPAQTPKTSTTAAKKRGKRPNLSDQHK
jgi:hypothetical protein